VSEDLDPETSPETDPETSPETDPGPPPEATPEATGHAAVDEVLASLSLLDGRPAADHVSVFESAHDRLRAALADAGDGATAAAPA
jgi:hypothetical protein